MKVIIDRDSGLFYYPVAAGSEIVDVELTEEELAEWEAVCAEYDKWQDRLEKLFQESE